MADLAALNAAIEAAEATEVTLIDQRRANRESMSPTDFRAYNDVTREEQIFVQAAVVKARKDLQAALTTVRSEALNVAIGTISESNTPGGAS